MNKIFETIKIISNLKNTIIKYLTECHKNILEIEDNDFIVEEIISKDDKMMNRILEDLT
jgi:hypothetical protein